MRHPGSSARKMTSVYFFGAEFFNCFELKKNMISTHANDFCEKKGTLFRHILSKKVLTDFYKHVGHTAGSQICIIILNIYIFYFHI